MIDFLRGMLVHKEPDFVVLDVNGVGYRIFCANPSLIGRQTGEELTLYIHYHVREDAHLLFGFATREEQRLFRLLLEVSGIGPRVALGVMSGTSPAAFIQAIRSEDISYLLKLPGVGRKTAQRIVLDLKDKVEQLQAAECGWAPQREEGVQREADDGEPEWLEAKQALEALGYRSHEVAAALQRVRQQPPDEATVDRIIREALKALAKA